MSRWCETASLEVTLGASMAFIALATVFTHGGVFGGTLATLSTDTQVYTVSLILLLVGLTQIAATIINGLALCWTPYARFLACLTCLITYGSLGVGGLAAAQGLAVMLFTCLSLASLWVCVVRAGVIVERICRALSSV